MEETERKMRENETKTEKNEPIKSQFVLKQITQNSVITDQQIIFQNEPEIKQKIMGKIQESAFQNQNKEEMKEKQRNGAISISSAIEKSQSFVYPKEFEIFFYKNSYSEEELNEFFKQFSNLSVITPVKVILNKFVLRLGLKGNAQIIPSNRHYNINISHLMPGQELDDEIMNFCAQVFILTHNMQFLKNLEKIITGNQIELISFLNNNSLQFFATSQIFQSDNVFQQQIKQIINDLNTFCEPYSDSVQFLIKSKTRIFSCLCRNHHWIGFSYQNGYITQFESLNMNQMVEGELFERFVSQLFNLFRFTRVKEKIPQQQNAHDCGIYVLKFIEGKTWWTFEDGLTLRAWLCSVGFC
ncbi:C-terminal catalytic domain [Hexamita inflata]|uniref:C-terminal catalytic domain n=1 Tax=Hexamita inflata TaxID=28002 RepID=A0AA86S678_9EUKA|nr:C-terminal catalytic domain [Hexamita inflata]CAI9978815.1 C-terminal catalytic domain [Hexamita inflata]CAI9978822.1 C-terminal catalytic domain [Hexamita inflata]